MADLIRPAPGNEFTILVEGEHVAKQPREVCRCFILGHVSIFRYRWRQLGFALFVYRGVKFKHDGELPKAVAPAYFLHQKVVTMPANPLPINSQILEEGLALTR